jgi:hypothetical protein
MQDRNPDWLIELALNKSPKAPWLVSRPSQKCYCQGSDCAIIACFDTFMDATPLSVLLPRVKPFLIYLERYSLSRGQDVQAFVTRVIDDYPAWKAQLSIETMVDHATERFQCYWSPRSAALW